MTAKHDEDRIDELVKAFDGLVRPIQGLVSCMRSMEASIKKTGRMMLVQTVLATVVLLALLAMAWLVWEAKKDVAAAQEMLAKVSQRNAVAYEYLEKKFPEDSAEIALVREAPSAVQAAFEAVDPVKTKPLPAEKLERKEAALKRAIEFVAAEKAAQQEQRPVVPEVVDPPEDDGEAVEGER